MANVRTFAYRNSKDKVIGVYLGGRVFYDHGVDIDIIEGVIRIPDRHFLEDRSLVVQVACEFVHEDVNWEVHEQSLYNRQIVLHPNPVEAFETTSAQRALVKKINGNCFPFVVRLPHSLPASVILKPETYYEGKPVGVSWVVRAWLASSGPNGPRTSSVSLPIQKINYTPLLTDVKPPTASGQKTFMFDSGHPLSLNVALEKDVFYLGEPINVKVTVENLSKKEVYAIRVSAKQITEVRYENSLTEKYKSQVALLESTRGCPVKKHSVFTSTYSITPKPIAQETHHVTQEYKLNMADPAQCAASTRLTHTGADDNNGVYVSYYINVHAVVALGADLIVKVPFILSLPEPPKPEKKSANSGALPTGSPTPPASILSSSANSLPSGDVDVPRLAPPPGDPAFSSSGHSASHNADVDLLIDFDDGDSAPTATPDSVSHHIETAELTNPFANPFATASPPQSQQGLETSLQIIRNAAFETQRAYSLINTGELAAGADAVPVNVRVPQLVQSVRAVGSSLSQVVGEVSQLRRAGDLNASLSIASGIANTASSLRSLSSTTVAISRSLTDPTVQHALLSGVSDVLEKSGLLVESISTVVAQPASADDRNRISALTEYISQALPAVVKALPGQRELQSAIDTITTTASHLDDAFNQDPPSNPAAAAAVIVSSADLIHSRAVALSDAFKALGTSCATPGMIIPVAAAALQYRAALPPVLAAGRQMAQAFTDVRLKTQLLTALKNVCQTSVRLLTVATVSMIDGSPAAKKSLEDVGSLVVESMRALLNGTTAIRAQYESLASQAAPASGATPAPAPASAATDSPAKRFVKANTLVRRDSFEDFIQQASRPLAESTSASSSSNDLTAQFAETDSTLRKIAESVAIANKTLLDTRARPRRASLVANQPVSQGTVIDSIFPIVVAVSSLIECARSRVNELSILGRSFHSANFSNRDRSFTDVLVATARELSTSVTSLVSVADKILDGSASIDALIQAANGVSSDAARLVSASQVQEHVNSNSQLEVEGASRAVTKATGTLIAAAEKVRASSGTPSGSADTQKQVDSLEKDLQSSQRVAFGQRKGSLWKL